MPLRAWPRDQQLSRLHIKVLSKVQGYCLYDKHCVEQGRAFEYLASSTLMSEGMSGTAADWFAAPPLPAVVGGAIKGASGFAAALLAAISDGIGRPIRRPDRPHAWVSSMQETLMQG